MTVTMTQTGRWPPTADLGTCRLRRLTPADSVWGGAALAALDPWRTLGSTAAGLGAYLTAEDPALHRFVVEARAVDNGVGGGESVEVDVAGAVAVAVGGNPVGIICLRDPWLRGPFIELLAVMLPGQGYGATVLAWAAAHAGANLWSTVSTFNHGARNFYRRIGFVEVVEMEGLVRPGFDDILLRRRNSSGGFRPPKAP